MPGFWSPRIWNGFYPRPTRRATQPGALVAKALVKQEKARLRASIPLARRACAPPSTQTARQYPRASVRRVRVGEPGCCGTDPNHPNHPNHHPNHRRPPHPPQWRRRQPSGPLLLHIHSSRWCRCCIALVRRRTQLVRLGGRRQPTIVHTNAHPRLLISSPVSPVTSTSSSSAPEPASEPLSCTAGCQLGGTNAGAGVGNGAVGGRTPFAPREPSATVVGEPVSQSLIKRMPKLRPTFINRTHTDRVVVVAAAANASAAATGAAAAAAAADRGAPAPAAAGACSQQ